MSTLSITVIQVPALGKQGCQLAHAGRKINSIGERTEVVVLPEMFSTGFTMNAAALATNR